MNFSILKTNAISNLTMNPKMLLDIEICDQWLLRFWETFT